MTRSSFLFICLVALFWVVGFGLAGATGALYIAGVCALVSAWRMWSDRDRFLRRSGARRIEYFQDPDLVGMVRALAARADLPTPELYIIDEPQCNALAVGHSPSQSALVLTTGAVRKFTGAELASVIGHELTHIKNRDAMAFSVTATFAGTILSIALLAGLLGLSLRRESGGLMLLIGATLTTFAALCLQAAISREREYEADLGGAQLGSKEAMISALRKADRSARKYANQAAEGQPITAPLYFVHPFPAAWLGRWFSTHPTLEQRIARLRAGQ
jgi:heat shock protein HtpX